MASLALQSYHSEHLAKILRDRLVQSKTIDRLLDEFKAAGYLDDEAWLESFKRIQQKRYSLPLILTKLQAKGLSKETLSTWQGIGKILKKSSGPSNIY